MDSGIAAKRWIEIAASHAMSNPVVHDSFPYFIHISFLTCFLFIFPFPDPPRVHLNLATILTSSLSLFTVGQYDRVEQSLLS